MRPHLPSRRLRAGLVVGALGLAAATTAFAGPASATPSATSTPEPTSLTIQSSNYNLPTGAIKHVWLIILENKSYDATFTGLNKNSYLWQTLPSQGVLLKNYYGTGHSSQDNYLALASGQAPSEDVQQDCSVQDYDFGSTASTINTGTADANNGLGQVASTAGANHSNGQNGCTYPTSAPTLFNQLDSAGKTWKDYDQDLGGASPNSPTAAVVNGATYNFKPGSDVTNRDASACGGPGSATNFPGAAQTGSGTGGVNASLTGSTSTNSPSTYGVTSFTGAQKDDQYVAKHNPAPWFHSLVGTGNGSAGITTPANGGIDCDSNHVANLDNPTTGLEADLSSEATTPAFSWITPNNCSDAHDATCVGNNLSGAFDSSGNPIYNTTPQTYDPESTTPTNFTGGLYASDLFLRYYVPLIERSAAFRDGGLIDVTFDEANPPFTYSNNSFNNQPVSSAKPESSVSNPVAPATQAPSGSFNSTAPGDTSTPAACPAKADGVTVTEPCEPGTAYAPGEGSVFAGYGIDADAAGENLSGTNVNREPTGPNSTLSTDSSGNQLTPGPGNNSFIDRPSTCSNTGNNALTVTAPAACVLAGGGTGLAARTDASAAQVSGGTSSSQITDQLVVADDIGRAVTDTVDKTGTGGGSPIPPNSYVGLVSDQGPNAYFPNNAAADGKPYSGSFQLVDANGNPVTPTGNVTSISLPAESGATSDPLYDATDATPGGGDTGSVLISPYITPGTSTTTYYNHYSWLRTMEDLFNVSSGVANTSNNPVYLTNADGTTKYTVAGGLDGLGHLGYAAQTGLESFGSDVFNNPAGNTPNPIDGGVGPNLPEAPLAIGLPLVGLAAVGAFLVVRRRQRRGSVVA